MRRAYWIGLIAGLALAPSAFTQQTAVQPAEEQSAANAEATIPADEQATHEQLARLFEVMRLRQQFEAMMKMLPNLVQQQVHAQMEQMAAKLPDAKKPTPEQQAALDQLMNKYMEKARTIYPADEMIEDAITIYQRHMSGPDVDAYIAFFSSPSGQHFLDAQPVIMKEYMPLAMQRAQERSRELNAEMAVDLQKFVESQAKQATPEK